MQLVVLCAFLVLPNQSFGIESGRGNAPWAGETLTGLKCPERTQGFGPFDYLERKELPLEINIVEGAHFSPEVEALTAGKTATLPIPDIDYTLRAWPNHHRALNALIRWVTQKKQSMGEFPPVECYLQRAINYSPKDVTARLLYAIYLHKIGHTEKALRQYEDTEKISPDNPELHYNLGLLLVSMKKYDEAKKHALKAYQEGYPLPGLKNQLARLGYWQEK